MYNGMILILYDNKIESKWNTTSRIRYNILMYTVYNTEAYTYLIETELQSVKQQIVSMYSGRVS